MENKDSYHYMYKKESIRYKMKCQEDFIERSSYNSSSYNSNKEEEIVFYYRKLRLYSGKETEKDRYKSDFLQNNDVPSTTFPNNDNYRFTNNNAQITNNDVPSTFKQLKYDTIIPLFKKYRVIYDKYNTFDYNMLKIFTKVYVLTLDDDFINQLINTGLEVGTMRERNLLKCNINGKKFNKRKCIEYLYNRSKCLCDYILDRNKCYNSHIAALRPFTFITEIKYFVKKQRSLLIIKDLKRLLKQLKLYYSFNYNCKNSLSKNYFRSPDNYRLNDGDAIKNDLEYEYASIKKEGFLAQIPGVDTEEYECRILNKKDPNAFIKYLTSTQRNRLFEIKKILDSLNIVRYYKYNTYKKRYEPDNRGIDNIFNYIKSFGKYILILK